ncbi:MAG: SAM-dependent methyltransferase [Dehalococcoidia bacterium]|nr:SAM-dependent methyltransferase [Dehalococcoidia bacterium]
MIEGSASRTAVQQAGIRAVESLMTPERRVCYDPLAVVFLDENLQRRYRLSLKNKFQRSLWIWSVRKDPGGTRAEGVARTRYIDDYSQACIKDGVEQVVILGAGFDSRAYRLKAFSKVKVFEVDHPNTQKTKAARLKTVLKEWPTWVTLVPVDFEKDRLDEKLLAAGYRRDLKTLFIWEGVTPYLTAEAVDRTLSLVVANSSPGSSIIFDYLHASAVDPGSKDKWAKALQTRCERLGEPIRFGIEGSEIETFLAARGFSQVKRVTASNLTELCFKGQNSKRQVCPFAEIVHATIGPPQ